MNFLLFKRILALPLSTTETAVCCVFARYVQKDGNSCYPSYETIKKESGASNKTISKVIRTLRYTEILEFKHRANVTTGKESNEYFFNLNDVGFYRDKLSKENSAKFKEKITQCRTKVVNEMKREAIDRKTTNQDTSIPSQNDVTDTVTNALIQKSQNVNNDVCNVAGLKGVTIPSQMSPIPSQMLRRSNRENVQPINSNTNDSTTTPCNEEKKKTVLHDKDISSLSSIDHDSNNPFHAGEKYMPSEQTTDEWLADYESTN